MKKVLVLAVVLFFTLSASAQVFTYSTKIGNFNGPVKSVLSTSDMGVTVDYYAPDGRIEKSLNSAKDEYTLFSWGDGIITQKFYNNSNDEFIGESLVGCAYDDVSFVCGTDSAGYYYWDFNNSTLYILGPDGETIMYRMTTENKTSEGYDSVVYVDNKPVIKTKVKTYDPDEYGNYARFVTITPDGVEHERLVTYEYY
jgi:hypothetical protein